MKGIKRSVSIYSLAGVLLSLIFILSGCGNQKPKIADNSGIEIIDFLPLSNLIKDGAVLKSIPLDYTNAFDGFVIPSARQVEGGAFIYKFSLKNNTGKAQKFRYKLYFQNETYKFPECDPFDTAKQNANAHENFYGSWMNNSEGFRETNEINCDGKFHEVSGTFQIAGNPREEKLFYQGLQNDRWKRNPRTGKYSFLLVVLTDSNYKAKAVPDYVGDLSKMKDSIFINPYHWFLYGEGSLSGGIKRIKSADTLKVYARVPVDAGIYIEPDDFDTTQPTPNYTNRCGRSEDLKRNAPFHQFSNFLFRSSAFDNIPVIEDVLNGNYTLTDYNWNRSFHSADEMIRTSAKNASCPCTDVYVDTADRSLNLKNPASSWGNWQKQNAGLVTRHGFTYGTYTIKVKLPELLNKYGIWNGLTNAIWLITQSPETWNNRRSCTDKGYIKDYSGGKEVARVDQSSYSEIDFEILKTSAYCPEYIYPPAYPHPVADRYRLANWNLPYPGENEKSRDEIMVCCTNWDMACPEPKNFDVGCQEIMMGDQKFYAHRWDHWYKAITEKMPASDNELFGSRYYYFQIEWRPEEIIWRIGPEKEKLRVAGYMNSSMTSVPNNQMLLVISQEFHSTAWWPGSPFEQGYIPFPARELKGKIMEITIE